MSDIGNILYVASVWVIPVLVAITFHEAAHGWVASKLGDDTALRLGRVTFNPLKHIDPFGTVLLPALLILLRTGFIFGYAKPVPVNFARLRDPKRHMIVVAAAGPGANILLACASAVLLHVAAVFAGPMGSWLGETLKLSILINIWLAVFNMLPVPPLDGGRVLMGVLPTALSARIEGMERQILLGLIAVIFFLPVLLQQFGIHFSPIAWLLVPIVETVLGVIVTVFGLGAGA